MIRYDPNKFIKKLAPENKIEKLITPRLGFKRSVFKTLANADFIDKNKVLDVVLKTINNYNKRAAQAGIDGDKLDEKKIEKLLSSNPKQLVQRVQNAIVWQVSQEIKEKYKGEYYIWLPSDADEPDPEHQLNYGKKFQIGVGEQPQDRYGCKCGMDILVNETELKI